MQKSIENPKHIFIFLFSVCWDQKYVMGGVGGGRGWRGGRGRSCRLSEVEAVMDVAGVCEARRQQHIQRKRTVIRFAGNQQIPNLLYECEEAEPSRRFKADWFGRQLNCCRESFHGQHVKATSLEISPLWCHAWYWYCIAMSDHSHAGSAPPTSSEQLRPFRLV